MDRTQQWQVQSGDEVFGADEGKLGKVSTVQPNYVVVEKGFFFPTDYYIPTSAISSYDDGKVYLNVTKDQALNEGWDVEPIGDYDTTTTGGGYVADMGSTSTAVPDDVLRSDAGTMQTGYDTTTTNYDTTRVADTDTLRVPIHEEELSATKTQREIGQVRVDKDVISEEKTLEVPVTEERVRVERHVVDRPVGADDTAFQEGTIEVPVRGEDVQLQKSVRVAEEVEIGKEAVQRTQQVSGTVRREEVRVTDDTAVTGTGMTGSTVRSTTSDVVDAGEGLMDRTQDTVGDAVNDVKKTV